MAGQHSFPIRLYGFVTYFMKEGLEMDGVKLRQDTEEAVSQTVEEVDWGGKWREAVIIERFINSALSLF